MEFVHTMLTVFFGLFILSMMLGMAKTKTAMKPNKAFLLLVMRCAGVAALVELNAGAVVFALVEAVLALQRLGMAENAAWTWGAGGSLVLVFAMLPRRHPLNAN